MSFPPGVYHKIKLFLVLILVFAHMALIPAKHIQAFNNVIIVNSLSDDQTVNGTCSQAEVVCLRNAIATANSNPSATTIYFGLDGIIMVGNTLVINNSSSNPVTIDGRGQRVAIDGQKRNRVIYVSREAVVTVNALTIQNGNIDISSDESMSTLQALIPKASDPAGINDGAGIFNAGMLTINNCTLVGNATANGSGGGIGNLGTLTITNSTVSNNTASHGSGAGLYTEHGVLLISNTSIVGNTAWAFGGGIYGVVSSLTISNSTIAYNSADLDGGLGITEDATLNLFSTIIAKNLLTDSKGSYPDLSPGSTSLGHNLIGDAPEDISIHEPRNGINLDQLGYGNVLLNPKLGVLASNGGLTQTVALLSDSPAISNGDCNGNPNIAPPAPVVTTDQRGVSRSKPCTIGAFEATPTASATLTATQ